MRLRDFGVIYHALPYRQYKQFFFGVMSPIPQKRRELKQIVYVTYRATHGKSPQSHATPPKD